MSAELEKYLKQSLDKLEKACEQIMKTKPYDEETEKLRMLYELTKEQVNNENSSSSTCTTR